MMKLVIYGLLFGSVLWAQNDGCGDELSAETWEARKIREANERRDRLQRVRISNATGLKQVDGGFRNEWGGHVSLQRAKKMWKEEKERREE